MRQACLLAILSLGLFGCGVPDVVFEDAGDGVRDATPDQEPDSALDADARPMPDAADARDGADGALAPYCVGDAGPPDAHYICCPSGVVCNGSCNTPSCVRCGACAWPSVCCTQGSAGTCSPPGTC